MVGAFIFTSNFPFEFLPCVLENAMLPSEEKMGDVIIGLLNYNFKT